MKSWKTALLTGAALLAFAANSVFARLAMSDGAISAFGYTGIRLLAGAAALVPLLLFTRAGNSGLTSGLSRRWPTALALLGYALAFSLAYLLLGTGTGALILFASVQFGMLGWGMVRGERLGPLEWLGLMIAFGAFLYLVSPGLVAPHPLGSVLMVSAGLCWAAYSLIGRGSATPLADTTGNFLLCAPIALLFAVGGLLWEGATLETIAYAVASGALASGLGYAIWYAVLPSLARTRAAVVQLLVPAIAALGGVVFIGESLTPRLVISSVLIISGVALAILAGERRKRAVSGT